MSNFEKNDIYNENRNIVEEENDIKAVIKRFICCYKENGLLYVYL